MGPADTMSNIMHDNMAYHDALSDVLPHSHKIVFASGTPTHATNNNSNNVNIIPSHGTGTHKTNLDAVTPSSCSNNSFLSNTSGATINSSQAATSPFYQPQPGEEQEPGVVYYMQDQNGQLTATRIPQRSQGALLPEATLPAQDPRFAQHNIPSGKTPDAMHSAPAFTHQISQLSDQSSVVNPGYGPYSQAAAVQKALQHLQQQQNQLQQYQLEQNVALQHLQQQQQQQGGIHNSSLQQQQEYENPPSHPTTSQPQHSSTTRGNAVELQEMPGRSFFMEQPQHHAPTLTQQPHHQSNEHHHQQQHHHENLHPAPPTPHKASQSIFQVLSPPQPQEEHHHQPVAQPMAVRTSGGSHPSTPSTRRAAKPEDIPLTNIPNSEIQPQTFTNPIMVSTPGMASSDSEGYKDTAIGSSLSASPGVGLEAPVDLAFQPDLSHDPRPPNDLYLESIDLSSALPEVHAVSPASHRRGNNARPDVLALSPLNGKVSKV
ncbi:hypothetical protein ElyMa_002550100 [Elysia marginata]|uniref:Transducer of regulated CREB activity middle domain-containing protein n=1 Tax=Elysia marginata TaxID=1093978 RepID=A0AAV4GXB5_9GAST|nr:hypothetical protein ElyMa_002550100 [Elysia marginata]